jgi:alpha-D-ribose 1-methylphosphonate 5-phosphate C-P lyase
MTAHEPIGEDEAYSFAYIDDDTKRSIRRAILKAVAIPGHQVPFGAREMPLPYGWGTGGIQLTASIIGRDDVLKVIDQGADDTTNAISIRRFFQRVAAVRTTKQTQSATIIQTRHRIPEQPLTGDQVLVFQVPHPEPLRGLVESESEARKLHALGDYSLLYVKLYEDIARWGRIATPYDYPVLVNGRYVASPSPIPKFDNPKMHRNCALFIFGAGRERRIYAIPPYTDVVSLDFQDYPFVVHRLSQSCAYCGSDESFLDETIGADGCRSFACSDTDFCEQRRMAKPNSVAERRARDQTRGGS